MNSNLPVIAALNRPAPIQCSALLCRDQWPDRFDVIVSKRDMMLADDQTKATSYDQWMAAKSELRRRGYDVWESFDDRSNSYIASCVKRHNDGPAH